MRHVLTNVLGARDNTEIHMQERKIGPSEILLLCTDGLHGSLDDSAIREVLSNSRRWNGRRRRWCVRHWTGLPGQRHRAGRDLRVSDRTRRPEKPACGPPESGSAATRSSTGSAAARWESCPAHDELMGREVAVKVMMTDLEGEPDIRARFMREAQVSAKLAHRNIVTIFDIGEDNGRLFIVMELLKGDTLDRALKQRAFSIEEKVDLTLEVCEGLAVASAAGVVHRDVKPGNLFVQADGGLKILDFGIARLASSSMTASGFIVGTPDYMSPEQARGVAVDERSDIFSAGAVFY